MINVHAETTIEAPVDAVWAVLGEGYGRLHEWFSRASSTTLRTDPPIGLGTVRVVKSGPLEVIEEIVVWEPGERLGYTIEGLPPGARDVRTEWTLHPRPDGSTVAQVHTTGAMKWGVAGKVIRPVFSRSLASAGRLLAVGLKEEVEGRGTSS